MANLKKFKSLEEYKSTATKRYPQISLIAEDGSIIFGEPLPPKSKTIDLSITIFDAGFSDWALEQITWHVDNPAKDSGNFLNGTLDARRYRTITQTGLHVIGETDIIFVISKDLGYSIPKDPIISGCVLKSYSEFQITFSTTQDPIEPVIIELDLYQTPPKP